jgi:GT2 family glycosyltransferase
MTPAVSIIIPTHKRPRLLRRLLTALASQPERESVAVCVVHDGEPCHCYLQEKLNQYDCHLVNAHAGGPAKARNIGMRVVGSEWIAFLDDDCVPAEDYLSNMLSFCRDAPVGVFAGMIIGLNGKSAIGRYQKQTALLESHSNGNELVGAFAPTANLLVHKSTLARIGGFDERFRVPGGEDNFFCLKLLMENIKLQAAASIRVYHENESSLSGFIKRYYCYGRGFARFLHEAQPLTASAVVKDAVEKMSRGLEVYCRNYADLLLKGGTIISAACIIREHYGMRVRNVCDLPFLFLAIMAEAAYQAGAVAEQLKLAGENPKMDRVFSWRED